MKHSKTDNTAEEMVKPPFPEKITFKEMLTNLFNADFLTEEELRTISDAAEMYANGCIKNSQPKDNAHTSAEDWLINEGYPSTMPMTRDNLAIIINRYVHTQLQPQTPIEDDVEKAAEDEATKRWQFDNFESKACRGAFVEGAKWDREKQQGMKWIKASERLPDNLFYGVIKTLNIEGSVNYQEASYNTVKSLLNHELDLQIEWLDESAPKQQGNEAVEFADWKDAYLNSRDLPLGELPSNKQLYQIFKNPNNHE